MTDYTRQIYSPNGGITTAEAFADKKVLHLGCGNTKLQGAIGVDRLGLPSVDVVHNLDLLPWPFADMSVDIIYAHSVVEHVEDLVEFFDESWRILRHGGRIIVAVPYFRSVDSFTDPTHRHFFTSKSLDYFVDAPNSRSAYQYSQHLFSIVGFWYGWPNYSRNFLTSTMKRLIHRHKAFYDQYLSIVMPVKMLVWELEKP